jgi:predicted MPP superfamily phosphohydrolase
VGRTHGGQLRVTLGSRQWSPASLVTPCVAGLYRLPLGPDEADGEVAPHLRTSAYMYVNRGLGTFGLPVRPGVSLEITVLRLRKAGDQPQCLSS